MNISLFYTQRAPPLPSILKCSPLPLLPSNRLLVLGQLRAQRRFLSIATSRMAAELPKLKLNDGHSIPMLGFGTGTAMFKRDNLSQLDETTIGQIKTAIDLGFRHIDGAETYNTEPELGSAVSRSGFNRDQFFITTKCSKDRLHEVKASFDESLKKLGLEYVDLYLLHAPFVDGVTTEERNKILVKAWNDCVAIKESGKAKSIGVSNFSEEHLDLLEVTPAVNQVELHLYLQQPELRAYMKRKGIAAEAYGPLVPITKAKPGPADETLAKLAEKYGVGQGEICLRWCIDNDIVPISTSSKEQRLKEYLRVCTFKLTEEEIAELSEASKGKHFRAFWGTRFPAK